MKQPNADLLLKKTGITIPMIGMYDTPNPSDHAPLVHMQTDSHVCLFAYYQQWLAGKSIILTSENYGCGGAGNHLFGVQAREKEAFIKFLVEGEGLKATPKLMNEWLDHLKPFARQNETLCFGPLVPKEYNHLLTVTFFVTPDQLSLLTIGAQYHAAPSDPLPVIAPFGSSCMMIGPLFDDFSVPQAIIGATDIAMRQFLPPEILAFTVTRPMFERLCSLDEKSFLFKPFWKNLQAARRK